LASGNEEKINRREAAGVAHAKFARVANAAFGAALLGAAQRRTANPARRWWSEKFSLVRWTPGQNAS
jgi:hypothetical protein